MLGGKKKTHSRGGGGGCQRPKTKFVYLKSAFHFGPLYGISFFSPMKLFLMCMGGWVGWPRLARALDPPPPGARKQWPGDGHTRGSP